MSEVPYPQLPREKGPPVLRRTWHGVDSPGWTVSMSGAGDVIEGAELWLPQLVPVTQTSRVDLRAEMRLDGVPIDIETIAFRWRWDPFRWARQ